MEITIRINEFMGQTEDGRYKLRVDTEELRNIVAEHTQTMTEQLFTTEYMAKHPKRIEAMLQSPQVRHLIWQKEEQRRHAQEVLHEANKIAETARKQIQHDCRHLTTEELESLQSAAE